jgi:hypothetical protein
MGQFVTVAYFFYFIPLLPFLGFVENAVISYQLRHASVLLTTNSSQIISQLPSVSNNVIKQEGERVIIEQKILGVEPTFNFFFSNLELIQVCIVGLFILFLGIFLPKSGEFTRFLNKLSFTYLIFLL